MLHRCDVRDGEGWRGGDRTDEARKRHENHGNRGSSWIAALGQHACRQSPRSSAGTAMLRLLHDRGQAGEFDRRSRLRQRSTRRGVAQERRRLSRYMRRWLVERLFAWIQWQRRILVRWEYYAHNFLGFVQLACLVVLRFGSNPAGGRSADSRRTPATRSSNTRSPAAPASARAP